MTTRAEFLERVRAGLGRTSRDANAVPVSPAADDRLVRLTTATEDLASVFAARAGAAGMMVHRCALAGLTDTVQPLVAQLGDGPVVMDHLNPALARPVADALTRCRAKTIDPRKAGSLDSQFDSAAGITGVLAAIAETGTLVVVSDADRSRGTFMIPPVHIAIVQESQLIADMLDLWGLIGSTASKPPTAVTLITGPSKTADIEGILVTGVHGPRAVHVLLVS